MKKPPKLLFIALVGFACLTSHANADGPFVVYLCKTSYKWKVQSLADDADPNVDPTGGKTYNDSTTYYKIVDLGDRVDDGNDSDGAYPERDIDDNTNFFVSYLRKSALKQHFFSIDNESDDGTWATFYGFYPEFDDSDTVQIRHGSARRPTLVQYTDQSWNQDFIYDEILDNGTSYVMNPDPYSYAYFGYFDGVVRNVKLPAPLIDTIVSIPTKVAGPWHDYYLNPLETSVYNELTDDFDLVNGKEHSRTAGNDVCIYSATLTAIVNGKNGDLTDENTVETLSPGSQAYAVLALIQYLESKGFVYSDFFYY